MEELQFQVLGPVAVLRGGRPVALMGRSSVNLLAGLLLSANQPVTYDSLADIVWGDRLPARPQAALQSLTSRLRGVLGGDVIRTFSTGYQISVEEDALDLLRFQRLLDVTDEALGQESAQRAVAVIDEALALWNLPVLANVRSDVLLRNGASFLTELYLSTQEKRAALQLKLGQYQAVIAELSGLVSAHPFREILVGLLMVALYRSHRQADALAVYQGLQHELREGLGVDPSGPLQRLYADILRGDDSLDGPDTARALITAGGFTVMPLSFPPAGPGTEQLSAAPARLDQVTPRTARQVPRQLPPDIGDFTGRGQEIPAILQAIASTSSFRTIVIAGPGGIGKSALAVHAGHKLSPRFPDGQVYLDMTGSGMRPGDPADLAAYLLVAFGVARELIPGALHERVGLYRSLVADKRFLLIFDHVRSESQVRELLPPGPQCGVIICTRTRLAGFPGARLVEPGVLDESESVTLLSQIIGQQRLGREPAAAAELARYCGGLPLALRIAGARLAAKPHWQLAALARRLADERRRLSELAYGDLDVRASISLSYRKLPPRAQVMLRKLALLEAADFPLRDCAALVDGNSAEAEVLCEMLVDAQLLGVRGVPSQPCYRLHDLVRAYAREFAGSGETPGSPPVTAAWRDGGVSRSAPAGADRLDITEQRHLTLPGDLEARRRGAARRPGPAAAASGNCTRW